MKFIVGVIVGFGIGVASSIVYSGQTGKDLREVYADVRKNVDTVDLEQFGQEVQTNVTQAQAPGAGQRRPGPGSGPGQRRPGRRQDRRGPREVRRQRHGHG